MKIFKKILYILVGLLVFILLAAFTISALYGDGIKRLAISEINKQIDTKIEVEELDFSLLGDFPFAQLNFTDVVVLGSPGFNKLEFSGYDKDTLLKAERLSPSFDVQSLIGSNLKLRKIEIESGKLNLLIDTKGNGNYHFWKEEKDTVDSDFKLDLNEVLFTNVDFILPIV